MISLFLIYTILLKKHKTLFAEKKKMFVFIGIISLLFAITLPFTTSDIFYYMGTGWLEAHYSENPYYTSVKDIKEINPEDELLNRTGVWEGQTVVYGPLWAFICNVLSSFSFGNVTLGLYVYKLAAVLIHLGTAILIYKIMRNSLFPLMYGLNPFILFEGITNVHNDLYLVFFTVLALYFLLNKKNIFGTILALALATTIKYVSILLLPFVLIYYFREKTIGKRIGFCILCGGIFLAIILGIYAFYLQDIQIFLAMFLQQSKLRESIIFLLFMLAQKYPTIFTIQIFNIVKYLLFILFACFYVITIVKLLFKKKIIWPQTVRKYHKVLLLFLFTVITNLCPWYLMWLYPCIMWLKGKSIKIILYLSFAYEFCTLYNFGMHSESYKIGILYIPTMIIIVYALSYKKKDRAERYLN